MLVIRDVFDLFVSIVVFFSVCEFQLSTVNTQIDDQNLILWIFTLVCFKLGLLGN